MTDLSAVRGIELFAGPGGMSEGAVLAGMDPDNMVGVEFDEKACATAEAAGHRRVLADVTSLDPLAFAIKHFGLMWAFLVLWFHASPPCQGFSLAGKGKGREDSEMILAAIAAIRDGHLSVEEGIEYVRDNAKDERSALTLEAMRWIDELLPETITFEQVPAVLPLWEAIAEWLRTLGYSVVTGKVTAEQYGVPQTRKRAILLASRSVQVELPEPTHSKYNSRNPEKLEEGMPRWVSMAEGLGWGMVKRPAYTYCNSGNGGAGVEWGGESVRERMRQDEASGDPERWIPKPEGWGMTHRPYPTIAPGTAATGGGPDPLAVGGSGSRKIIYRERDAGRWIDKAAVIAEVEPRVNNQSGTVFDLAWPADRPAPVIAGRGLVTMPGANANRFNGATKSRNDGIRITVEEAGVIQSFPYTYPWQGNQTKKFEQVGNAVPPLLGMHMIRAAFGLTVQVAPSMADAA